MDLSEMNLVLQLLCLASLSTQSLALTALLKDNSSYYKNYNVEITMAYIAK